MFNFFLTKYHPEQFGIKKYSKFDWIRSRYQFEMNKITNYYRKRIRAMNNNNIFSRMITLMSPNLNAELFDYFRYIDQDAPYIARQFKLVSNISRGLVLPNVFYNDNSYAIINHVETDVKLYSIKQDWWNIVPLRCTYTRTYNLDFYQMDRTLPAKEEELTIAELDIVKMLLQYRFWAKWRLENDNSTNPNVYVATVLYPNFVNTIVDIKLFNRFINLFYNTFMDDVDIRHPFNVLDYSRGIDDIYLKIQKDLLKANVPLVQLLRTIPTIYNKDMIDALYINNPYYTRQSEWSIWIARIRYFKFLIDFLGERGLARNRMYIYNLPTMIKRLENRSTDLAYQLPNNMYLEFLNTIEYIKEKIGRR